MRPMKKLLLEGKHRSTVAVIQLAVYGAGFVLCCYWFFRDAGDKALFTLGLFAVPAWLPLIFNVPPLFDPDYPADKYARKMAGWLKVYGFFAVLFLIAILFGGRTPSSLWGGRICLAAVMSCVVVFTRRYRAFRVVLAILSIVMWGVLFNWVRAAQPFRMFLFQLAFLGLIGHLTTLVCVEAYARLRRIDMPR